MSDEVKKTLKKIRTFAGDLEEQRKLKGLSASSKTKRAISDHKHPAPVQEKEEPVPPKPIVKKESKIVVPSKKETEHKKTQTKNNIPQVQTKIPAFHELQKQALHTHKNTDDQKTGPSVRVENKSKQKDQLKKLPSTRNIGYDSTVITDTKKSQFRLFPSIITSIKSWFKKMAIRRKQKSTPKYTIPETSRRKGVIQKATSKSGTIFTADNETLKEQIRRRYHSDNSDLDETDVTWSPYTEAGYNLLEYPEGIQDTTKNVVIEYKKQTRPASTDKAIKIVEPSTPTNILPEIPIDTEEILPAINESGPVTSEEVTPEYIEEKYIGVTTNTPDATEIPTISETELELFKKSQSRSGSRSSDRLLDKHDTNTLTIIIVIAVVGFVAIIFATRIIIQEINNDSSETAAIIAPEQIIENTQLVNIVLTTKNPDQLPDLIKTAITSAPQGLVELPVTLQNGEEVSGSYLFEILQFQNLPSLRESITTARFITNDQSKPVLLLRFVDINTVRGGMLDWEDTMAKDMGVLYEILSETEEDFIDETVSEIDVRLLKFEGEAVLIYGFVDENTLIIANSTDDFTQVTELKFAD